MTCFATPYALRYTAHCFNRADAQDDCPALIQPGGQVSHGFENRRPSTYLSLNIAG